MSQHRTVWMPFYVADYLRDTMHLTTLQHGAYMLLIMHAWSNAGLLPNDERQLARIAKMSLELWRKNWPVLGPFFQAKEKHLLSKRVADEHAKACRITEIRREAGRAGGRPRKANGKQNETPSPTPPPTEVHVEAPSEHQQQVGDGESDWPGASVEEWEVALAGRSAGRIDSTKSASLVLSRAFLVQWQRDGLSFELDVAPAVEAICSNLREPVNSWRLFDRRARQIFRDRRAPVDLSQATGGNHHDDKFARKRANMERALDGARAALERERDPGGRRFGGD